MMYQFESGLPISIESLLSHQKIESDRIEFKEGWNPDPIYRSISAFANDFDNIGGGYIIIGVKEKDGEAVRPVTGLSSADIARIEKNRIMVYNCGGPDRSIRLEDLRDGTAVSGRYSNHRLGDFLKEMDLAEGRSTGLSLIHRELARNGSPRL